MTETKVPFTSTDILERARELLEAGPIKNCWHGNWCPWCAISDAKSQLDKEYGTGLSVSEALKHMHDEVPSDLPLVEARIRLGPYNDVRRETLTQAQAIKIIDEILDTEWEKK